MRTGWRLQRSRRPGGGLTLSPPSSAARRRRRGVISRLRVPGPRRAPARRRRSAAGKRARPRPRPGGRCRRARTRFGSLHRRSRAGDRESGDVEAPLSAAGIEDLEDAAIEGDDRARAQTYLEHRPYLRRRACPGGVGFPPGRGGEPAYSSVERDSRSSALSRVPPTRRAVELEPAAERFHPVGEATQARSQLVRAAGAVVGTSTRRSSPSTVARTTTQRAPACLWTLASASATT